MGPFISTGRREDISPSASREPTKQAFRSSGKAKSFRLSERIIFKAFSFGDDPVTDTAEKLSALRALAEKYSPGIPDNEEEIQHALNYVFMVKLVPDWITGKRAALEVREAAEKL